MMPFFRADEIRYELSIPAEEALARIEAAVRREGVLDRIVGALAPGISGKVNAENFRLMHKSFYTNGFRPILKGRVTVSACGSVLEGRFMMHPAVLGFMAMWFAMAALFALMFLVAAFMPQETQANDRWIGVLGVFAMPLGGAAVMIVGWLLGRPDRRRLITCLETMFADCIRKAE